MNALRVPRQRAIIDRRALASEIDALVGEHGDKARPHVVKLLKTALDKGRAELERRLEEKPSAGHENAGGFAFMIDQLIRVIHDHATAHLYPSANRSKAERLAIMAVGGYGRSEMSPHSDVDIAFLVGGTLHVVLNARVMGDRRVALVQSLCCNFACMVNTHQSCGM